MNRILVTILALVFSAQLVAQRTDSTRRELLFPFSAAYQIPIGNLANQYGNFLDGNFGISYKTTQRFTIGISFDYLFEAPLNNASQFEGLANEYNHFIGTDGTPAGPKVKGRGFKIEAKLGKIIPLNPMNKNAGIWVQGGIGYLQHKVHIGGDIANFPMFQNPYVKGYDRLAGGLNYSAFIGYLYLPPLIQKNISDIPTYSNIYGLYAGIEFNTAYTYSLRSYQYDLQQALITPTLNQLIGFKIGWIFTINNEKKSGDHYY